MFSDKEEMGWKTQTEKETIEHTHIHTKDTHTHTHTWGERGGEITMRNSHAS